jgi:hypothetical protein
MIDGEDDVRQSYEYLSFYGFLCQWGIMSKKDIQAHPLGGRK